MQGASWELYVIGERRVGCALQRPYVIGVYRAGGFMGALCDWWASCRMCFTEALCDW